MSTHDYIISDGSGSAVLSDMNNAFQALASTNKDSSRPGTAYAGQLQLYTAVTPWRLDIYDGSDWIPIAYIDDSNDIAYPYSAMGIMNQAFIINNTSDADHDIDFEATTFITNNGILCSLPATITKRLDAAWAPGGGNGGLDTGSIAASTTYHCYLIRKTADGSIDAVFSTGTSGPTVMPSGYDGYSRRGSIITDSSSYILGFYRQGTRFLWSGTLNEVTQAATPNGGTLFTVRVPAGEITKFLGSVDYTTGYSGTGDIVYAYAYPTSGDYAPVLGRVSDQFGTTRAAACLFECLSNTSSQIKLYGANVTVDSFHISSMGYDDFLLDRGL